MNDEALKHWGVLGMHWGVRKSEGGSTSSKARRPSGDHTRAANIRKKHISEMTNKQIKDLSNRLELEKKYKDISKSEVSAGRKMVNDVLLNTTKQLLTMAIIAGGTMAGKAVFSFAKERLRKAATGGA